MFGARSGRAGLHGKQFDHIRDPAKHRGRTHAAVSKPLTTTEKPRRWWRCCRAGACASESRPSSDGRATGRRGSKGGREQLQTAVADKRLRARGGLGFVSHTTSTGRRRKVRCGPSCVCCGATGSQRGGKPPLADLGQPAPLGRSVRPRTHRLRAGRLHGDLQRGADCLTMTGISGRRNGFGVRRTRPEKSSWAPLGTRAGA